MFWLILFLCVPVTSYSAILQFIIGQSCCNKLISSRDESSIILWVEQTAAAALNALDVHGSCVSEHLNRFTAKQRRAEAEDK